MVRNPALGAVVLVPVTIDDAAFIVEVRADAVKRGFLKRGAENAEMQRTWLREYFDRANKEYDRYFMITVKGQKCGTLRVGSLDPSHEVFTWGSWCLVPGLNPLVAIASYILAFEVGFSVDSKRHAVFEVHHANSSVLAFHRGMGAKETGVMRADQIELSMTREAFQEARSRWIKKLQ